MFLQLLYRLQLRTPLQLTRYLPYRPRFLSTGCRCSLVLIIRKLSYKRNVTHNDDYWKIMTLAIPLPPRMTVGVKAASWVLFLSE